MNLNLFDRDALISCVANANKPIAILVGAPLSLDEEGGVPNVKGMLELIHADVASHAPAELIRYEEAITGKSDGAAYQLAMEWLHGNLGHTAVSRIISNAVRQARRKGASADFKDDGEAGDWHISKGIHQLADLVSRHHERFPGPILTTNFDPLLWLAIRSAGRQVGVRAITSDGSLEANVPMSGECSVIHLHGYWRGSATLHTPTQLTAKRQRLKSSLQQVLKQRTLVVVAYGGWDDIFAHALSETAEDNTCEMDVRWCFYETDIEAIKKKYARLLHSVEPAISLSRFTLYGGIDCHSIFSSIAAKIPAASSASGDSASSAEKTISGWQIVDTRFLAALPSLRPEEAVRYFDGAVPTWRHALSGAIPQRKVVAHIGTQPAELQLFSSCSMLLIRAASGEGKTTVLLQAAVNAILNDGYLVLARTSPRMGLQPEQVLDLDPDQKWLVVVDEADDLIADLEKIARRLHETGRTNIHFLVAARDTDWRVASGDQIPWHTWLHRRQDVILKGIVQQDAQAIVEAWSKHGADGLRALAKFRHKHQQVWNLIRAVGDDRQNAAEGSFFGGLLAVRFDQRGLQDHVRDFLARLKRAQEQPTTGPIFDALLYVAACHAVGIPGIEERVLADLVSVPRDWIYSRIVRPLGEEAAAVRSAGHVMTRHPRVAAAILVEAETAFDIDLAEVWRAIVRQTVRTGDEGTRVGETFDLIVHAGPHLQRKLPSQLPPNRRHDIAISAAKAAVEYKNDWLGCVDSLAKTYRVAGKFTEAAQVLRDNLEAAQAKVDYSKVIRAFYNEWSVCEGHKGPTREHAAADAWLGILSLSDHLAVPVSPKDVKLACAGLGTPFGKMAEPHAGCIFAKARNAVLWLGQQVPLDQKAEKLFATIKASAKKSISPHPAHAEQAITWLADAAIQLGRELRDPFLAKLAEPNRISFRRLHAAVGTDHQRNKR